MIQRGGRLRLADEARTEFLRDCCFSKDLERHVAIQARIERLEDVASCLPNRAALRSGRARTPTPGTGPAARGGERLGRLVERKTIQQVDRGRFLLEEQLDFLEELSVALAGLFEKSLPIRRVQRRQVERLNFLPALEVHDGAPNRSPV